MDAYIIPKTLAYIFLSTGSPTTLHFDEPIEFMQAGKGSDFDVTFSKDKKSIVMRPVGTFDDPKTMVILAKDSNFHFKLINSESRQHDFVYIHRGRSNSIYTKKFEDEIVKVLEGETSAFVVNKCKSSIEVNGLIVEKSVVLSKGLPIFVNGKRVY